MSKATVVLTLNQRSFMTETYHRDETAGQQSSRMWFHCGVCDCLHPWQGGLLKCQDNPPEQMTMAEYGKRVANGTL